jgi:UMF1 family MFS transporter
MLFVKEPPSDKATDQMDHLTRSTLTRLRETLSEIRQYKELFKFLLAFWIYNDGIGTVIRMAAIYGSQLGIGMNSLVGALLLTQFIGVPFSLLFGKIAQKWGTKEALYIALSWYTLIAVSAVFLQHSWHFWILAIAVGMVQGGAQAISRSMYASMVPVSRSAEFFSFYDISSKFAGIAGPALFGLITQITGSSRFAIASLSLTFVIGMMILRTVRIEKGTRTASLAEENSL